MKINIRGILVSDLAQIGKIHVFIFKFQLYKLSLENLQNSKNVRTFKFANLPKRNNKIQN